VERIEGLRAAKPEAFHRFFEEWFPRVHALALRHRSEPDAAAALTERILARALEELGHWRREVPFARWMLALAVTELLEDGAPD